MPKQEDISHFERKLSQLKKHIAEQDAEMFRQSKLLDNLTKRLEKLEGRIDSGGMDSPVDAERNLGDERPPHY